MTKKFAVGDVVRLISGGPWMTIQEICSDSAYVRCRWFSDLNKSQLETFVAATLKERE